MSYFNKNSKKIILIPEKNNNWNQSLKLQKLGEKTNLKEFEKVYNIY